MTDAINWNAPLHAPTEPGKYVSRSGKVVTLRSCGDGLWEDEAGDRYAWSGAFSNFKPYMFDIIGKYVEPPPDEMWKNVYPLGNDSNGYISREIADEFATKNRTHIKRYVLAEIINLSDDTSGDKP